ncbi:MAG: DDE-type integrase/transposase/recombinase [Dactylosporangium sp.]|nr:DDE-type integrase/transposase/recombinase [Dactylosporangium sp.]NNJ63349.1 DDE-type integrase/transposase/recombinase [Dactylosporangium sp.]
MIDQALRELTGVGTPVRTACRLLGRARATHYRRVRGPVHGPRQRRQPGPQALDDGERAAVLEVINRPGYSDLSIGQIWARELDEGRYRCSPSSMYRIAAAAGQTRERRRQATHPAKVKPELVADGPSQVWSWDITKIRGPVKGVWYHLYVLIDVYSRYNQGWILAAAEDSVLARDFIDEATARNGQVPHTVHADRGTSMTSQSVSAPLTNLGVTRTHSRPRVSDDNPFSEAQFKTLKYLHDFPGSFPNLSAARAFLDGFFTEYDHVHRHSGIGWHTPASVHFGTTATIDDARQATLDAARAAHPNRSARRPRPPQIPDHSWINQPAQELQKT